MKPGIDSILNDCTMPPEAYMAGRLTLGRYDKSELTSRMCIDLVGRTIRAMTSGTLLTKHSIKEVYGELADDLETIGVNRRGSFSDGYEAACAYAAARIRRVLKDNMTDEGGK